MASGSGGNGADRAGPGRGTADPVVIGGPSGLTPADVVQVARRRRPVMLDPRALERIAAGRALVDAGEPDNLPASGWLRAQGVRGVDNLVAADKAASGMTLLARAAGTGAVLSTEAVRAALAVRLSGLAVGGAGVRPVVAQALVGLLNHGIHPIAPAVGATGASDRTVMATIMLPLLGEGRAEIDGETLSGAGALRRAGLEPLVLAAREGLALVGGNAVSAGIGSLVLSDADRAAATLDAAAVVSLEAFRGNPGPLDPRIGRARPAPGQAVAAARLRGLLQGSDLLTPDPAAGTGPRRLQDPPGFQALAPVHGALLAALDFVRPAVTAELVGAGDNPLLLPGDRAIVHTGNGHTPVLGLGFDMLMVALAQVASLSAQRTARLMQAGVTGLPDLLSPADAGGGTRVGLRLVARTAAVLVTEIKLRAQPASLLDDGGPDIGDPGAGDADARDDIAMTAVAVRQAGDGLGLLRRVIACELLAACQALDLRFADGPKGRIAPAAERLYDAVRMASPMVTGDRPLHDDIEALAGALAPT